MEYGSGWADRINSYALVAYIPDPLADFLNRLRKELDPTWVSSRAHVTVLPPRPLVVDQCLVARELERKLDLQEPFEIEARGVEIFASSSVVYIEIGMGGTTLKELHAKLNEDGLYFAEPYSFHPHITLVQGLMPEEAPLVLGLARERWSRFPGKRSFRADKLSFVQNTVQNRWLDLVHYELRVREPHLF